MSIFTKENWNSGQWMKYSSADEFVKEWADEGFELLKQLTVKLHDPIQNVCFYFSAGAFMLEGVYYNNPIPEKDNIAFLEQYGEESLAIENEFFPERESYTSYESDVLMTIYGISDEPDAQISDEDEEKRLIQWLMFPHELTESHIKKLRPLYKNIQFFLAHKAVALIEQNARKGEINIASDFFAFPIFHDTGFAVENFKIARRTLNMSIADFIFSLNNEYLDNIEPIG